MKKMNKTLLGLMISGLSFNTMATEIIDHISFNQLSKYHNIFYPGKIWNTNLGHELELINPIDQKFQISGSPYTYSDSKHGSFMLHADSEYFKPDPNQRYTISLKTWKVNKEESQHLQVKTREGFFLFDKKSFGRPETIYFNVMGSQLKDGFTVHNMNVAIDDITIQKHDENKMIINFDYLSGIKHGSTHKYSQELNSIRVQPVNQKAGTKNDLTFSYGNTDAYFEILAHDPKSIDSEQNYRITALAGSSTTKSSNKSKVRFFVSGYDNKIIHEHKGLFGVDWKEYSFTVTGKDLLNGIKLNNKMVKIDDIVIKEVGKTHSKKSLIISSSDTNGNGDYSDIGDLIGSHNDGMAMKELAETTGFNTNHNDNVTETEFRQELERAVEETADDGTLFVFFAGHMSSDGDFSTQTLQIPTSDIKNILNKHNGKKVVMFESCGSEKALNPFKHDENYSVVASSSSNEFSFQENFAYEFKDSELAKNILKKDKNGKVYMGVYSFFMHEGIGLFNDGNPIADTNFDGVVSLNESFTYAYDKVKTVNDIQTPVIHLGDKDIPLFDLKNK